MAKKIKVVQHGVGAKGKIMAAMMLKKKEIELVGAVDLANVGKDLGEVIGLSKKTAITISDNLEAVLAKTKPDVVLDATLTHTRSLYPMLMKMVDAGAHVISIGAQMFNPWVNEPELAKQLHEAAIKKGVAIVGTGTATGFRFDVLPLFFTGVCARVDRIICARVSDAAATGDTFRKRCGFGFSKEEAEKKLANGEIELNLAHPDQAKFIADAMGWGELKLKEEMEFFVSTTVRDHSPSYKIEPGQVSGYRHDCFGTTADGKQVLELKTLNLIDPSVDGLEPSFKITIEGDPTTTMSIPSLAVGDNVPRYAAAHAVNWIPHMMKSRPGLLTDLRDYAMVSCLPE
jgi:hypothetical protein